MMVNKFARIYFFSQGYSNERLVSSTYLFQVHLAFLSDIEVKDRVLNEKEKGNETTKINVMLFWMGYLHDEYREVLVEVRHFVHEGLHRQ